MVKLELNGSIYLCDNAQQAAMIVDVVGKAQYVKSEWLAQEYRKSSDDWNYYTNQEQKFSITPVDFKLHFESDEEANEYFQSFAHNATVEDPSELI